jgi:hypothetical protein
MDGSTLRSQWPMDDELHERMTAGLSAAGLADAVATLHSPSRRGTTRWQLELTDERRGPDVADALAGLRGVWGLRFYSADRLTFDVDRAVPDAGRPKATSVDAR